MSDSIYVVEDDFDLRHLCAFALRTEGHDVHALESGRELVERLRAGERPALVVVDLGLPDVDGRTLIEEALTVPNGQRPRIIIASGRSELPRLARDLGVQGYLMKPYDMSALFEEVRRVLN